MCLSLMQIVSGIFISVQTNCLKNTILFMHSPRHGQTIFLKNGDLRRCVAGYRANVKTVSLLQRLLTQCGRLRHHCDDQIVLNAFSYDMKWMNNTGFSIQYDYRISVFKIMFVSRANLHCESWISMDLSRKKIEAKLKYGNHILTRVLIITCLSNLEIYAEVYIIV